MKRLLHTPLALLVWRIVLLYAVLMLCRTAFYLYNAAVLGPLTWAEAWPLLAGALKFDTASVVYADGVFILLSLLPLPLRERRWYRAVLFWYYVAVNAVLVVATNLADTVYFRYTQKRFTADEIFFADNDNSLQLVGKFMAENWYLVLLWIALTALLAWGYRRRVREESIFSRGWAYYIGNTVIFAAAAGLSVAGMRGGMTRMTRPITLSNATLYTADSGKANLILSNPFCILRTIGSAGSVKYKKHFAPEELARRFTPVHQPADSAAVNLAGRNVVVFIMESMSAEHSAYLCPEVYADREVKGFTPFLDSLMQNGLVFKRMYANGTRSIQAMPSVLGSIPSFRTPFVLMAQSLGESRQLPAMLADKGYATLFFCGSEHGSMGFGAYARSAGVERLVSREDYEARHGTGDFDGYWGIWDEPFLQFMGEELAATPEPFFATLFTLSSHHPFVVPEQYAATLPDGYTRIHKGVAYDDQAFRRFFHRFGGEEWFRRTIFVFVADHVSSEKFAEKTRSYPGNMHIVGFIHTPDGALQGEVREVTQQLDIMPTVLGLTGNTEPYFAFGRDVLNEPQRPRWSVSYDGKFRALTDDGAVVLDDSGSEVQECPTTPAADSLTQSFRALIQQYYSHIERKSYTPND
ncbi:LTA synthase family protein [Alistipes senegalensis]|uniref:Sulfatase-like hydrolase/transferase n=1 Tax=Alistipes senegalensis JC50 TaxID=1033732 RepID=A0ABY5V7V4_9BACT|nr:LTA synthase family protein [Alistipes senegalensis]UEA86681.1 sulfatase-like hydrolase/transferase [Alistipes senegalensis]UWN65730.1 sulfatase-like hydrolase/transferase [Alistipes senegalensis JC50]